MGENTKIEWAHHTFNPWMGCTKVSDGCKFCYAEELMDKRYGKVEWGPVGKRVRTSVANWRKPLQWDKQAAAENIRYRVFCSSLADVFEDRPELKPWRADLFDLIHKTQHLDWLLLTKRPENIHRQIGDVAKDEQYSPFDWLSMGMMPPNVWIGTSVENQEQADKRIPHLLNVPAAVRFLSCEPLLGPVDLSKWLPEECLDCDDYILLHREEGPMFHEDPEIHWVIAGGESGPHARPMNPEWVRLLRDQCEAANVPFLFKQWGEYRPFDEQVDPCLHADSPSSDLAKMHWPYDVYRVGKKVAGRLLDGRTWDEFPT